MIDVRGMVCLGLSLGCAASASEGVPADESLPLEVDTTMVRARELGAASAKRWHVDVGIGTDFPVEIGGRVVVETPWRLRGMLSVGGMPRSFQRLANNVLVASGTYDASMAAVVDETIREAFVLQVGLGWRPLASKGLVFDVGYRMVQFSSRNTPTTVLAQVSSVVVPLSLQSLAASELRIRSYVHQVTARVGWEWVAQERLTVRLDVGGTFSLDTSHLLSIDEGDLPQDAVQYKDIAEQHLDSMLRRYGHFPTVGLSFGYRFF